MTPEFIKSVKLYLADKKRALHKRFRRRVKDLLKEDFTFYARTPREGR